MTSGRRLGSVGLAACVSVGQLQAPRLYLEVLLRVPHVLWVLYVTTCLAGQDHSSPPQSCEEAWWVLVCLCWQRQLLGLPSLSQEAQDHRCDQLGGGEGTESVEQYLVTFAYSTCLFSLRA